jgi:hypothetical protein
VIEVHDGCACSVAISEDADAAAEADALAHPKLALTLAVQPLVHLVCLPPHLGRGIRLADPFGRPYGTGTVTVVSGVVTVAIVPLGVVTVAAVIGVMTVTVAATVADGFGIGGGGTADTRRMAGSSDGATTFGVDVGAAVVLEPSVVLT